MYVINIFPIVVFNYYSFNCKQNDCYSHSTSNGGDCHLVISEGQITGRCLFDRLGHPVSQLMVSVVIGYGGASAKPAMVVTVNVIAGEKKLKVV